MWLIFKICSEKMTQVYDYKSFINYMVVEDPILRGYYNLINNCARRAKLLKTPF